MIKKLSTSITNKVLKWGYSDERHREIYEYNLHNRLSAITAFIVILLTSLFMQCFLWGLVFYTFFTTLSGVTGGYHAPTLTKCILLSNSAFLLSSFITLITSYISTSLIYLLLMGGGVAFAGAMIFLFAPIDHPNLGLTANEVLQLKTKSRKRFLLEVAAVVLMVMLRAPKEIVSIAMATMMTLGLSIMFAKLSKQEEKEHEKREEC